MRIFVTAKPNAKKETVVAIDRAHYQVGVKESPQDGRANEAILAALSRHLKIPRSKFTILTGHRSKNKMIGIDEG